MKNTLRTSMLIIYSATCMEFSEKYRNKPTYSHAFLSKETIGIEQKSDPFTVVHQKNKTVTITHKNGATEVIVLKKNKRKRRTYISNQYNTNYNILILDIQLPPELLAEKEEHTI